MNHFRWNISASAVFFSLVINWWGCGGTSAPRDGGGDGYDGQDGDAGPEDGGPGAKVHVSARAVKSCGSFTPDRQTGLSYQTPFGVRAGVLALELMRSHKDSEPVSITLPEAVRTVDLDQGGDITASDGASVPAGTYTHVRVTLANALYKVRATAHTYLDVEGELETDMALSNYQPSGGSPRSAGQYQATFSAYGQSQSFSGSTILNCTLSLWGGKVTTAGGRFQVTVPIPGGPLVIPPGAQTRLDVELVFPVQDQFVWRDLGEAKFAAGVYDVGMPPAPTEVPDSLFECQMFLADRCQGEAVVALQPSWPMPDSHPLFCTDGARVVSPCPAQGEPGFGQDSNYLVHPLDYSAVDGVVEDRVTGLLWQQEAPAESFDWWEARAYCAGLELGGHDDWRLPSRVELVSLIDFGRLDPVIDPDAFPGTPSDFFWTASPVPFLGFAYGVRFELGFIYDHDPNGSGRVRCVRGAYQPLPARFSTDAETVLDLATQLRWQRRHLDTPLSWLEALSFCENLNFAGRTDWRLPTLKELQTLVDERRLQPSIDIFAFPDTPAEWFWSATPIASHPDQAWATSYTDGYASIHAGAELHRVRCVHD